MGSFQLHVTFFSCPEQLNRWPCHSLTHRLTDWVTFTFAIQRAILETCYHWDMWSDWWGDMTLSTLSSLSTLSTLSTLRTLSTLSTLRTLRTLRTLSTLITLSTLSHCWHFFLTIFDDNFFMTIFDDNFLMKILDYIETIFDNWKDSPGDLTCETLITILKIENLNSVNHSYLTINCDTGQHSQFLRCFIT